MEKATGDGLRFSLYSPAMMQPRRPLTLMEGGRRMMRLCMVAVVLVLVGLLPSASGSDFEPYQLNGGLVSAVAGRDFVVLASDTRFMGEGGYEILSRNHIESRLWFATGCERSFQSILNANAPFTKVASTKPLITTLSMASAPTLIGSSGCNADCEALKRVVQADLRSALYFQQCSQLQHHSLNLPADQVATLLAQVLYSRRFFAYYAFCVVGGLGRHGAGQAYVYDAIGSYEQVAVASAGVGRELLQPILDGKFQSLVATTASGHATKAVPTQVDCSPEQAVAILIDAYKSVSEREIGVGDSLVLCVLRKKEQDAGVDCDLWRVPLKQH